MLPKGDYTLFKFLAANLEDHSVLETGSGNLPKGSDGHNMDNEEEEYEMDTPATPSAPAKHTSILS